MAKKKTNFVSKSTQKTKILLGSTVKKIKKISLKSLATFGTGLILGVVVTSAFFNKSDNNKESSSSYYRSSSNKSVPSVPQNKYEYAHERIGRALQAGKLNQEQVDKLNKKVDELKEENKNKSNKQPTTQEVMKNRQELHDWAKQNNVPSIYIVTLN